jgi:predicted adenylyl cyclase CyaB
LARNIEIKARVENPTALFELAATISDSGPVEILQDDTFFHCPNGRLKLRDFSSSQGQLIFYQREDVQGPKESRYFISNTSEPASLRLLLELAFGISGRVRKRRLLFLAGNTRIHLDEVEGLGHFMELEVVLTDGESVEAGQAIARDLMAQLAIPKESLLTGAYVDMLSATLGRCVNCRGPERGAE